MPSIDPEAVRSEAKRWTDLADEMSAIRQSTADLQLGIMAFFPGGFTEPLHHAKYQDCLDRILSRLQGAAIEFELIGTTLRNIADDYDEGERVSAADFRVTEQELERATDAHGPPGRAGSGPEYYI